MGAATPPLPVSEELLVPFLLAQIHAQSRQHAALVADDVIALYPEQRDAHKLLDPRPQPRNRPFGWLRWPFRKRTRAEPPGEEERLTRVAARELLKPQFRQALPNGVLVVVIGCGRLGINIAGELARRGCRVKLCDVTPECAHERFNELVLRVRELGAEELLLPADVDHLLSRCSVASSVADAVEAGCSGGLLIVESVPDKLQFKHAVFSAAAAACAAKNVEPSQVLFISNSLTLSVESAAATMPPEYAVRAIGVRFMHPVWFVDEVEVTIGGQHTLAAHATPLAHAFEPPDSSHAQPLLAEAHPLPEVHLPLSGAVEHSNALHRTQSETRCFLAAINMSPFLVSLDANSTRRRLTSEQWLLYMARQKTQCAL